MDHVAAEDLKDIIKWPGGVRPHILDIGANQGQFAREMRETFGNAFIYSIEANPICEVKLQKGMKHGTVNEYQIVALGKEEDTLDFFRNKTKPQGKGASFYPEITDTNLECVKIPVRRLDDVIPTDHYHLIKIDVQGHEGNILKKAKKTLTKKIPIMLEFEPVTMKKNWINDYKYLFMHYNFFYNMFGEEYQV
jgi:FkbM family methyltransferase